MLLSTYLPSISILSTTKQLHRQVHHDDDDDGVKKNDDIIGTNSSSSTVRVVQACLPPQQTQAHLSTLSPGHYLLQAFLARPISSSSSSSPHHHQEEEEEGDMQIISYTDQPISFHIRQGR